MIEGRFEVVNFVQSIVSKKKIGTSLAHRRDSFVAGACVGEGKFVC